MTLKDKRSNESKKITVIVYETQEPPTIVVDPESWDFDTVILGNTDSKEFTVTCANVTDGVSINRSGNTGMFSVTNNTDSTGNGTFTVTYNPNATGTHTMTLYINCAYGPSDTVTVTGKCINPIITVSPTSLSFETVVNSPVEKKFYVSGTNLTGALTLSSSNSNFSLSTTSISRAQASEGVEVTVTYNRSTAGSDTGTITVSGGGADSKTVSLTGSAVKPTMNVSPTSLSFESVVNTTSLPQSITVTCTNMPTTPSVTLSQDIADIFKITSNTLGTTGGTLKVTFTPEAARNYGGTIRITGGGITQTVNLTGTGKGTPTITVNPASLSCGNVPYGDGSYSTKTFTVTGANLTDSLTVRSSDKTIFSVSPMTITPTNGSVNATVTVTYKPSKIHTGNQQDTGTITVSGGDAEPKTVSVSGRGINASTE